MKISKKLWIFLKIKIEFLKKKYIFNKYFEILSDVDNGRFMITLYVIWLDFI